MKTEETNYAEPIPFSSSDRHTSIYRSSARSMIIYDYKTLYDVFIRSFSMHPERPCHGRLVDSKYEWKTYDQVYRDIIRLGSNLMDYVKPQTTTGRISCDNFIGIYASNSVEWATVDLACSFFSLVSVSIYDSLGREGIEEILKQTGLTVLFTTVDKIKTLETLKSTYNLRTIIVMDRNINLEHLSINDTMIKTWDDFNEKNNIRIPIRPNKDMVATICYTSGTTGVPKGAVLTHWNIVSVMSAGQLKGIRLDENDCHLSYLPMAHMFERIVQTVAYYGGCRIGFSRGDPKLIVEDIKLLRPTIFPSVPRLYNRIYDMILKSIHEKGSITNTIFNMGFSLGQMYRPIVNSILGKTIFKNIRAVLGGRVRLMITGSAPIQPEVLEFMRVCFGCPVIEGYGQTETAAGVSLTAIDDHTVGHVGGPLACNEVRLESVEEMNYLAGEMKGEICYRGDNIFKGYYGGTEEKYGIDPIKTAEAIDKDGWLHSGDIGQIMPNGSIKIIDRKKNIFKLSQGEYIAPEKLENIYSLCPDIHQIFIYGDSLQSSLIGLVYGEKNEKVLLEQIKKIGKEHGLKGLEIPTAIARLPELMTVENGLLTPTFKFKRHEIARHYNDLISSLYKSI